MSSLRMGTVYFTSDPGKEMQLSNVSCLQLHMVALVPGTLPYPPFLFLILLKKTFNSFSFSFHYLYPSDQFFLEAKYYILLLKTKNNSNEFLGNKTGLSLSTSHL